MRTQPDTRSVKREDGLNFLGITLSAKLKTHGWLKIAHIEQNKTFEYRYRFYTNTSEYKNHCNTCISLYTAWRPDHLIHLCDHSVLQSTWTQLQPITTMSRRIHVKKMLVTIWNTTRIFTICNRFIIGPRTSTVACILETIANYG